MRFGKDMGWPQVCSTFLYSWTWCQHRLPHRFLHSLAPVVYSPSPHLAIPGQLKMLDQNLRLSGAQASSQSFMRSSSEKAKSFWPWAKTAAMKLGDTSYTVILLLAIFAYNSPMPFLSIPQIMLGARAQISGMGEIRPGCLFPPWYKEVEPLPRHF